VFMGVWKKPVCASERASVAAVVGWQRSTKGVTVSQEPHEIDPRNNAESQQAESGASQTGSRSGGGGAIFSGAREAGSVPGQPDPNDGDPNSGVGAGNPLAGVLIDPVDAEQAVAGDEGPEHPGRR
jgi:hypothetical protein